MSLCCQHGLDVLDPARITQPGPGAHHAAQPCLAEEPAPAPPPCRTAHRHPFFLFEGKRFCRKMEQAHLALNGLGKASSFGISWLHRQAV